MTTQDFAGISPLTFRAAADLSASQYRYVALDTAGRVALVASAGGFAIGVLQNKPAALDAAASVVTVAGVKAKVVAGDTVTAGDILQSDDEGRAITASTGDFVTGKAVTGGAVGELIETILFQSHLNA